jgi:hypothetical protein
MFERLLIGIPIWLAVLALAGLLRIYSARNLALVAVGSGLFLFALTADPDAGLWIGLAALGAAFWVRGADAQRNQTRALRSTTEVPASSP